MMGGGVRVCLCVCAVMGLRTSPSVGTAPHTHAQGSVGSRDSLTLSDANVNVDVLVYGATGAGVMSALAAAQRNHSVLLMRASLVDGDHGELGGMFTTMGCTDVGNASVIGGMARKFYNRIGAAYGNKKPVYSFEPKVAQRVLSSWIDESSDRIRIVSGGDLLSCQSTFNMTHQLSSRNAIITTNTMNISATVLVDATGEADLAALCGATLTWGRESSTEWNESLGGRRAEPNNDEAAHTQFHYNISFRDPTNGDLLPLVQPFDNENPGESDFKTQSYTFRLTLTNDSSNRVPIVQPEGYNSKDWELLRLYVTKYSEQVKKESNGTDHAVLRDFVNLFPLPNNKADLCNYGPLSTNPIGLSWGWPNGTSGERAQILRSHELYQRGFWWTLANDLGIPQVIRNEAQTWGLPKDEFTASGGWPRQLYVREARRLVGEHVFTQADRVRGVVHEGDVSICLGSYAFDSNLVQRMPIDNQLRTEGGIVRNCGKNIEDIKCPQIFEVPASVLLPALGDRPVARDWLLCPMALSASHVGYASLRLNPQYAMIGEASGVLAALAVEKHLRPRDVLRPGASGNMPGQALTEALKRNGALLHADDIIMRDDALTCYEQEVGPKSRQKWSASRKI